LFAIGAVVHDFIYLPERRQLQMLSIQQIAHHPFRAGFHAKIENPTHNITLDDGIRGLVTSYQLYQAISRTVVMVS
jgi:hypothetical protein